MVASNAMWRVLSKSDGLFEAFVYIDVEVLLTLVFNVENHIKAHHTLIKELLTGFFDVWSYQADNIPVRNIASGSLHHGWSFKNKNYYFFLSVRFSLIKFVGLFFNIFLFVWFSIHVSVCPICQLLRSYGQFVFIIIIIIIIISIIIVKRRIRRSCFTEKNIKNYP